MIEQVIWTVLTDVDNQYEAQALEALLGQYQGEMAVFTGDVPEQAPTPYITITCVGAPSEFGCRQKPGFVEQLDVAVFGDKTDSTVDLRLMGLLIFQLFHRKTLDSYLEQYDLEGWGIVAEGPILLRSPDGFPGYVVKVRARLLQT